MSATRSHLFAQDFEADQHADQSNAGFSPQLADAQAFPWPALQLAIVRTIYYLGFLLLPVLMFWVGLSREDLLHGLYLALLLIYFLPSSLSLEPSIKAGAISWRQVSCACTFCDRRASCLCIQGMLASTPVVQPQLGPCASSTHFMPACAPCEVGVSTICDCHLAVAMRCYVHPLFIR